jgi:prepilin-type N-terminal cleavage/methylation domain-containing protein/prepilin-type processing-associated H-X9-DG protein
MIKVLPMPSKSNKRLGFTLIELLVVIAIIAILISLLVPAVQKVREASNRAQCQNNLKQMALAFHSHLDARRLFPSAGASGADPARSMNGSEPVMGPTQVWNWAYQILPYLEQHALWHDPSDAAVKATPVVTYFCPSRRAPTVFDLPPPGVGGSIGLRAQMDYAGNLGTDASNGLDGMLVKSTKPPLSMRHVVDGTSNTVLLGERWLDNRWYSYPPQNCPENDDYRGGFISPVSTVPGISRTASFEPKQDTDQYPPTPFPPGHLNNFQRFGSAHSEGFQAAFVDGSVRLIRYTVNLSVFQAACRRAEGTSYNLDNL